MADTNQLKLIEQGIDVWNRWRENHPDIKPDLSQAYLYEAELSGANFSGANLSRACLIGANLKEANFKGADLQSAYGSAANLTGADLSETNLCEANFSEANLTNANFFKARAENTNFSSAILTGACLESWQIATSTLFQGVTCPYFYLKQQKQERFPSIGEFAFTDFTKLIQDNLRDYLNLPPQAAFQAETIEAIAPSQPPPSLPKASTNGASNGLAVPKPPQMPTLIDFEPWPESKPKDGDAAILKELTNGLTRQSPNSSLRTTRRPASNVATLDASDSTPTITVNTTAREAIPSSNGHPIQAASPSRVLLLPEAPQVETETDRTLLWFMGSLAFVGVGAAIAMAVVWINSHLTPAPVTSPVLQQNRIDNSPVVSKQS
ncbi:MAG TPA: pentapeptide repeat-containing protein [Crinalium sp.]|jgi:hypothetical protein